MPILPLSSTSLMISSETIRKISEGQQAAFQDFCAHFERFRQFSTVDCRGPGSTYELQWNSIVIIVMQKLPDDIPIHTVEGLFEIIKRSFIKASAIH